MLKQINKNVLFVTIIAVAVLAFMNPFSNQPAMYKQVHATGECLRKVPKDRVSMTIEVRNLTDNIVTATEQTSATYKRLSEAIEKMDNLELETTRVESYEKTEWNRKLERRVSLGFESVIAFEVVAENAEDLGKVMLIAAGQPDVFTNRFNFFTSKELQKVEREACMFDATRNAREKAEAIAEGGKARIGRMISAHYSQGNFGGIMPRGRAVEFASDSAVMAMGEADVTMPLHSRDEEISITVNATFELR
ncbi:MAG: SIMPL domain-containing protein [Alphaproteobacteria bacterium]|nr:SIMPL domain-containing protein [Alphaproteobacteria bacterium]